jgi:hypothetical protein
MDLAGNFLCEPCVKKAEALMAEERRQAHAGGTLLCCECWKPIDPDDAVVRTIAYAVAAYHRCCGDVADSSFPRGLRI